MNLPYSNATTGDAALGEIGKILTYFGCDRYGHMHDQAAGQLLVQFTHKGRNVSVAASFRGYANAWLKENPYGPRRSGTKAQYEAKALAQAKISVCSILRDWIKAQVTMVEVGALSFEAAFLGQLVLGNGKSVLDHAAASGYIQIESGTPT